MGNSASYFQPVQKKAWYTPMKVGSKVPNVDFKLRVRNDSGEENPFEWKNMTSEELFAGKRIVLFALPGAFTPTCSSKHVPGYAEASDEIKSLGVDEIFCVSVNDAFVMRQWGLKLGLEEESEPGEITFKKVKFLPDGNGFFTRGMGMSCMFTNLGFGERSWRYSVVINDLVVEQIFIEGGGKVKQNPDSDPFEVSDAKTMVDYLKSKNDEDDKKKAEIEEKAKPEEKEEEPKPEGAEEPKDAEGEPAEETPTTEEELKVAEAKEEESKPVETETPKEEPKVVDEAKPEEAEEPKPAEAEPAKEEPKVVEESKPVEAEEPKAAEESPAEAETPKEEPKVVDEAKPEEVEEPKPAEAEPAKEEPKVVEESKPVEAEEPKAAEEAPAVAKLQKKKSQKNKKKRKS